MAIVIAGAGFSSAAGLPLMRDLFDGRVLITSKSAEADFQTVLKAWKRWREDHPNAHAEEFISHVYSSRALHGVRWDSLVHYIGARLATPLGHDRGAFSLRYAGRITRPVNVPGHDGFWNTVLKHVQVNGVVTTNYDILIERGLRHRPMKRSNRPGVYYGGFDRPQLLQGRASPFSVQRPLRVVELTGDVPIFKLHGSLNWSREGNELTMYQDLRPALRAGGDAEILPPLQEKEFPGWLEAVWQSARDVLAQAATWIVCGYSLPSYDHKIRDMFARAAERDGGRRILLLDPSADNVAPRWSAVVPGAEVISLPGLPDGIDSLHEAIQGDDA